MFWNRGVRQLGNDLFRYHCRELELAFNFSVSALIICSLLIPASHTFHLVWMYFGLAGGFLFILIQLVLLVDLSHSWSEAWVEKMEKASTSGRSRCWWVFPRTWAAPSLLWVRIRSEWEDKLFPGVREFTKRNTSNSTMSRRSSLVLHL